MFKKAAGYDRLGPIETEGPEVRMGSLLLCGRVIDAVHDAPLEDGAVLVEGERIAYVGPRAGAPAFDPATTRVVEAGEGTILPGFIDVHAHLTGDEDAGEFAGGALFGDQLIGAVSQVGMLLDAGFTGLRDMSLAGVFLARGVERGAIRGPRIVPGGRLLGVTAGHVDYNYPWAPKEVANQFDNLAVLVDGPDECTRAVREQFRIGAKFIKICATGGVSSPLDRVDDVQFSPEELRAIVDEARRHHSYVTAHCTGYEGAYQALLAGVECIEHGVMLTPREIDLMAERDVPLVSTLTVALGVADMEGPAWFHEKALACRENNLRTIEMARAAGIRIALGTDFSNSRNTPYKQNGREFEAMVRAGMTPMEAVRAGTITAAQVMRMDDQIGSLEAGKLADIVIVDGNPLEDIWCLTDADHVQLVLKGGAVEKDETNHLGTGTDD